MSILICVCQFLSIKALRIEGNSDSHYNIIDKDNDGQAPKTREARHRPKLQYREQGLASLAPNFLTGLQKKRGGGD